MFERGSIVLFNNKRGMVMEATNVANSVKYRVVFDVDTTEWLDEEDLQRAS